jgi:hypothetical protein
MSGLESRTEYLAKPGVEAFRTHRKRRFPWPRKLRFE